MLSSSCSITIWPPTISLLPPRLPPRPTPRPRPMRPRASALSLLRDESGTWTWTESVDNKSLLLDLTVMFFGLKWPMQARSTRAWSPEENTYFKLDPESLGSSLLCNVTHLMVSQHQWLSCHQQRQRIQWQARSSPCCPRSGWEWLGSRWRELFHPEVLDPHEHPSEDQAVLENNKIYDLDNVKKIFLPFLSVLNSVCAESFSKSRIRLFSST